jgi:CRISPR-associated endonuclease Cas2
MSRGTRRPRKLARPGLASTRGDPPATHTLAVFDVSCDRARFRLGELCKDYGLHRFQWSAFEGQLSRNKREELFERGKRLLAGAVGGGKFVVLAVGARELAEALRTEEAGIGEPGTEAAGTRKKESAG